MSLVARAKAQGFRTPGVPQVSSATIQAITRAAAKGTALSIIILISPPHIAFIHLFDTGSVSTGLARSMLEIDIQGLSP
jgi:fructose/tagatose bisphosphate aldolase